MCMVFGYAYFPPTYLYFPFDGEYSQRQLRVERYLTENFRYTTANGERLGTYNGHQGALWTVDVNPTTTLLATGAADNTIKLWEVQTGRCLKTWDFPTAVKRVEFSEDGTLLLAVTEMRMGHLGTVVVFPIVNDVDAPQADSPLLRITFEDSKATVAAWSYLNKYIVTGHEDGSVSLYDSKVWLNDGKEKLLQTLIDIPDRRAHYQ